MTTIWKYHLRIDIEGAQEIEIPYGAKILTAQAQVRGVEMWACVNSAARKEKRKFIVCMTGGPAPDVWSNAAYIATVQIVGALGVLVVHVFELL